MNNLSHADLLQLKRWNTPTIYNGWEQITTRAPAADGFNLEETRDFMPQMGPMIGYAVTVVIEPSNKAHRETNVDAWNDYRRYVAGQPGPKIVCVQDLDKPRTIGSFWGEVNSNVHRALGCVGTIVDGAIRDVDEMTNAGFKALARQGQIALCTLCGKDLEQEVVAPTGDLAFAFDAVFGRMLFQQTDRKSTKPR